MTTKTAYYTHMAEEAARQVTGSREQWTAFLTTAARLYKYPYPEQLMIFAQRPDATACAEYDLWNDRMNRYVKRGSRGIALVDASGEAPRLRYVFDVSDTGTRRSSRPVYLWKMEEEHIPAIQQALADSYGVTANMTLNDEIYEIAQKLAAEYWQDHRGQIFDIVADSYLEGYDEFNIGVSFCRAATTSIAYTLLTRTVGDADNYFEHEDFLDIFNFNTQDAAGVLGTAVSEMSAQVFREIERTIQIYERAKQAERKRDHEQTLLYAERGLSDPEHRTGAYGKAPAGQVRENAQGISAGEQHTPVQSPDPDREVVPAPVGDSGDGGRPDGAADDRASEAESGAGQEDEPASVGAAHEHAESAGGGTDHGGADHRISDDSRAAHEEGSYGQLSFLFPTEAEQIESIDEKYTESKPLAESEKPSAFLISGEETDSILGDGSYFSGGKVPQEEPPEQDAVEDLADDEPIDDTTYAEINGELREFPNEEAALDALEAARAAARQIALQNYHITNDHLGEGGPKQKFRANIMAIQLLKKCEEENRPATPEEQEILAGYVGWGGGAEPAVGKRHSVLADLKSRAAQIPPDRKSDSYEEVL